MEMPISSKSKSQPGQLTGAERKGRRVSGTYTGSEVFSPEDHCIQEEAALRAYLQGLLTDSLQEKRRGSLRGARNKFPVEQGLFQEQKDPTEHRVAENVS